MPHEAVIAAIEAMERTLVAVPDPVAERRRAYDRERKRSSRLSGGNPVESAESVETNGPPSLDKESFPQTPFKEIKPNPVCETRTRGTRIPDGWTPTKALPPNVKALVDQWPPGRLEREQDGFRDYWSSRTRNATMTDWDKGWHNRIRDQHDKVMRDSRNGSNRNGTRQGHAPGNGMLSVLLDLEADSRRAADDG